MIKLSANLSLFFFVSWDNYELLIEASKSRSYDSEGSSLPRKGQFQDIESFSWHAMEVKVPFPRDSQINTMRFRGEGHPHRSSSENISDDDDRFLGIERFFLHPYEMEPSSTELVVIFSVPALC